MNLTPAQRALFEALYRLLISAIGVVAEILEKPSPIPTRKERRIGDLDTRPTHMLE